MYTEILLAMIKRNLPSDSIGHDPVAIASQMLSRGISAIVVTLAKAEGSTPRNDDAVMLVTPQNFHGTIGGGQLEWIVLEEARSLLRASTPADDFVVTRSIPLGPEIGQCCGGKVEAMFRPLTENIIKELEARRLLRPDPVVQIHGAGHTGKALAQALCLLPFDVTLVDTRPDALDGVAAKTILSPLPEEQVRGASRDTAFVVLTHDHHLDFLLAAEALNRGDAAYVGMIGSQTKRAVFGNWLGENGYDRRLIKNLICPIGGDKVRDKRPSVIAALVCTELIGVFANRGST